jgi:hypothetical protein
VGWQFSSGSRRGPAQIFLRDVQLQIRPTNLVPPVERCPRDRFVQQSGVDLAVVCGDHDFGTPVEGGSHQGLSVHPEELRDRLTYLEEKKVGLARIALFRDLSAGLKLDNRGRILGLDASLFADVDALLDEAARHSGTRLMLVLFDSSLAERWPNLIVNFEDRQLLCEQVLKPFFSRYASSEVIYGMEVTSDVEGFIEASGEEAARVFVNDVLEVMRSSNPHWIAAVGHRSRGGLERYKFSGFDLYTFSYDPIDRHYFMKYRRDRLEFPPSGVPVVLVAKLPLLADVRQGGTFGCRHDTTSPRETLRPPLASYAIQDAFDYGYSGILFSGLESYEGRKPFRGVEAELFASWMSRKTESSTANSDREK